MKKVCASLLTTIFIACSSAPVLVAADTKEVDRVENSGKVMTEILDVPEDIPQDLLDKSYCVAVLPSVVK